VNGVAETGAVGRGDTHLHLPERSSLIPTDKIFISDPDKHRANAAAHPSEGTTSQPREGGDLQGEHAAPVEGNSFYKQETEYVHFPYSLLVRLAILRHLVTRAT
jgi:hypothetical protein